MTTSQDKHSGYKGLGTSDESYCNCPHPVESKQTHRKCQCGKTIHGRRVICPECGEKHNCGTCGYFDWIRGVKV